MNKGTSLLLMLLALHSSAQAEPFGRLFYTPAQRAALDQQRLLRLQSEQESGGSATILTMDGTVLRSSGRHTTWINGKPLTEAAPWPGGLSNLKVGETIHLDSGERTDLLKDGRLAASRPTPAGQP